MLTRNLIMSAILVLCPTGFAAQAQAAGGCIAGKPGNPAGFPSWLGLSLGIAPEFTQNRPFDDVDFEDSDKTTVSLTATAKHCLTDRFGIKISGGPGIVLDDNDNSSAKSKLPVSAELRWFSGIGPVVPLIAVGTAAYYEDNFGDHVGDDQFVEAGASFGDQGWDFWSISDRRKLNLSGRAVWRWVDDDSTDKGDYRGASADVTLQVPIFPKKINLNVQGIYGYSRYRAIDLVSGKHRRDHNLSVFAGIDISGLLKPAIAAAKAVSIGATWSKSSSNIDGGDQKLKLQPAIKLGMPF